MDEPSAAVKFDHSHQETMNSFGNPNLLNVFRPGAFQDGSPSFRTGDPHMQRTSLIIKTKPKGSDALEVDPHYSLHHTGAPTQQEAEPMQPRGPEKQQNIKGT